MSVADLKEEGGLLQYRGVWDWGANSTSSLALDPEKDKVKYTYTTLAWSLSYTLKDNANGNAVLEFTLPDGNHAQFEWTSRDTVKGRFFMKGVATTGKPATQTTMTRVP